VAQRLRCCATNWKVAGSIPAGVGRFFIDIAYFRTHYKTRVDSASNRKEYQGYNKWENSGVLMLQQAVCWSCAALYCDRLTVCRVLVKDAAGCVLGLCCVVL